MHKCLAIIALTILLPVDFTFACEPFDLKTISNLSLLEKIISGPWMILAAGTNGLSTSILEVIAHVSLVCAVGIFLFAIIHFVKAKSKKAIVTLMSLFGVYCAVNLAQLHTAQARYFCEKRPSMSEVLDLLLTKAETT